MGKIYDGKTTITAGFKFNSNNPLDDRSSVSSYSDLNDLNKWEGMIVYVREEKCHYCYKDGDWDVFDGGSASGIAVDSTLSDTSTNPVQNKIIKQELDNIRKSIDSVQVSGVIVDSALSETSVNPVQNKVVGKALNSKQDKLLFLTDDGTISSNKTNDIYLTFAEYLYQHKDSHQSIDLELFSFVFNCMYNDLAFYRNPISGSVSLNIDIATDDDLQASLVDALNTANIPVYKYSRNNDGNILMEDEIADISEFGQIASAGNHTFTYMIDAHINNTTTTMWSEKLIPCWQVVNNPEEFELTNYIVVDKNIYYRKVTDLNNLNTWEKFITIGSVDADAVTDIVLEELNKDGGVWDALDAKADKTDVEALYPWENVEGDIENPCYVRCTTGDYVYNGAYATKTVAIESGYEYRVTTRIGKASFLAAAAFFDADKNYIGCYKSGTTDSYTECVQEVISIPEGAAIMAVTTHTGGIKIPIVERALIVGFADLTDIVRENVDITGTLTWDEVKDITNVGSVNKDTGVVNHADSQYTTEKFKVTEGETYYVTADIGTNMALCVFYNASDVYVGYTEDHVFNGDIGEDGENMVMGYVDTPITIPAGVTYMRVSTRVLEGQPVAVVKQKADGVLLKKIEAVTKIGSSSTASGRVNSRVTSYSTTTFAVESGYSYRVTANVGKADGMALGLFYNENGDYVGYTEDHVSNTISQTEYVDELITIPSGATHMKVTTYITSLLPVAIVRRAKNENIKGLFAHTEQLTKDFRNAYTFKNKTIVNFGDSIFGNSTAPDDISTMIAGLTGATVYNCAFGGCRMAVHGNENYTPFSMFSLANAIVSGDYTAQDAGVTNESAQILNKEERVNTLKNIDFSKVDIVTIAYGTNDFTGENVLDDESNLLNTETFGGALRYSIETLLTAYPNLRIFICTPTWRFWNTSGEYTQDSDTYTNGKGNTLINFVNKVKEICNDYHLPCIDNYFELGFNKFNRSQYFTNTDGTHPILSGRQLMAGHIAKELF